MLVALVDPRMYTLWLLAPREVMEMPEKLIATDDTTFDAMSIFDAALRTVPLEKAKLTPDMLAVPAKAQLFPVAVRSVLEPATTNDDDVTEPVVPMLYPPDVRVALDETVMLDEVKSPWMLKLLVDPDHADELCTRPVKDGKAPDA